MDRDTTIILGAVFAALGNSLPDSAMTHAVEALNKIADADGTTRAHIMRIIAKGLTDGIQSVIKAV